MITLDQGGNQTDQEEPASENEGENILAAGRDLLNRIETAIEERGEIDDERDAEISLQEFRDIDRQVDENPQHGFRDPSTSSDEDKNGNQNPNPVEVLEIPEEEDSEEEHDTEREKANLHLILFCYLALEFGQ